MDYLIRVFFLLSLCLEIFFCFEANSVEGYSFLFTRSGLDLVSGGDVMASRDRRQPHFPGKVRDRIRNWMRLMFGCSITIEAVPCVLVWFTRNDVIRSRDPPASRLHFWNNSRHKWSKYPFNYVVLDKASGDGDGIGRHRVGIGSESGRSPTRLPLQLAIKLT